METEIKFVNGLYSNVVSDKAPDWVLANQSIHIEKLITWLQENKALANDKGYINITTKLSKNGKRYISVDYRQSTDKEDAEHDRRAELASQPVPDYPYEEINPEDIPFN